MVDMRCILPFTLPLKELNKETGVGNLTKGFVACHSVTNVIVDEEEFFKKANLQACLEQSDKIREFKSYLQT
jgi:hypothetical protein